MTDSNGTKGIRWWPLPLCLGLYALALAWIWGTAADDRQRQVMLSIGYGVLTSLAIAVWALFFARLARPAKRVAWVVVLTLLALTPVLVEIRGVSGDLIPILAWRWSPTSDERLSAAEQLASETAIPTTPQDYPRFLGPNGDGQLASPKLASDWTTRPPVEKWRIEVGLGWSSFAVVNSYAVTQEQRGDKEMVVCYDLATGQTRWSHADTTRHVDDLGGDGPRATPTLAGGKVYALGAKGLLNCLDLATGRKIWSVDILADNQASAPPFGVSASPLVDGDRVLVVAGGAQGRSLVAYDRESGARLFSGGDAPAGYSTPVPATLAGVAQYLVFNAKAIAGHAADNGAELWSFPWPPGSEHVANPLVLEGDRVVVSSGYAVGARLLAIAHEAGQFQVKELWSSTQMKAKFSQLLRQGPVAYGLDDGILACVDLETGARRWKGGRYGHGQVMRVGKHLLVLTERGEVALVDATPEAFHERAKIPVIQGKTWNHPALVGDLLLVRNAAEAVCLQLPTE